ncbi:hypothetical protein B0I31_101374 [Saccharothrix carnea]|uniref:Epoxide hydrolase-like protein n=1 Tax=Saccharothrix carnea TaxID=1280637 RepID=A0A2P8II74_SACCR|nr:hypothetical protein B0I31_101374 [Saccharothrix carnea]
MRRLGDDRYGAQGGDWGSVISRELGIVDAEHVVGVHLNMLITERTDNIVRWTEFDRGGHFAAMEQPGLLAEDVRAFFLDARGR